MDEMDEFDEEEVTPIVVKRKPTVFGAKKGFDITAFKTAITSNDQDYISDLLLNKKQVASYENDIPIEILFMDW